MDKIIIIPITEVLDDMGIKWWKGSREETEQTLKRLEEAFHDYLEKSFERDFKELANREFEKVMADEEFIKSIKEL